MNLTERALSHIWFPCSQVKDYESLPPITIQSAKGSLYYLDDGREVIDATSSWWCKSLGHQHPEIKQALGEQLEQFTHVIGTNTINDTLVNLSEKLGQLAPNLEKVFYASDGSMAVEIALKMSLHARMLEGKHKKNTFVTLKNSYHGETFGALSVSDVGIYKKPYAANCFESLCLTELPYLNSNKDPLWTDASSHWAISESQLLPLVDSITAIIVEPIAQGAGGMKFYSPDYLKRLSQFAKANDIHLICDEIMTGLGRTGKTFAFEHAEITPDFVTLSKGLTAGTVPMSAMLTSNAIYELFYDDYESNKAFLHSNTYFGNALACRAALTVLTIHERDNLNAMANQLGETMKELMQLIAKESGVLTNVRQLGAITAAEMTLEFPRAGFKLFQEALRLGAFVRPMGNTLYWLPPFNTDKQTLEKLANITLEAIHCVKQNNVCA